MVENRELESHYIQKGLSGTWIVVVFLEDGVGTVQSPSTKQQDKKTHFVASEIRWHLYVLLSLLLVLGRRFLQLQTHK